MNDEITVTGTTLVSPDARAAGDLSHRRHLRAADGRRVLRREAPRARAHAHAADPRGRRRRHAVLRQRARARAAVRRELRGRSARRAAQTIRLPDHGGGAAVFARVPAAPRHDARRVLRAGVDGAARRLRAGVGEQPAHRLHRRRAHVAVAVRHGRLRSRERRRRRIGDEVLRARRHRVGNAAVWHVADLRPHRHAQARRSRGDGHGRTQPRRGPGSRVPGGRGRVQVRRRAVPHVGARRVHRRAHRP